MSTTETKDGGPAFPVVVPDCGYGGAFEKSNGISIRDYFAGQALQGWAAGRNQPFESSCAAAEQIAKGCYVYADAMLKQREK